MAKTRMTKNIKQMMINHAQKAAHAYVSSEKLDEAYKAAALMMIELVQKQYPTKDMAVMKKYKSTSTFNRVSCVSVAGRHFVFHFDFDNDQVTKPIGPIQVYNCKIGPVSETVDEACAFHEDLQNKYDIAVEEVFAPYQTLINTSKNVEALIEAWPACASYARSITQSTAVSALSTEAIDKITSTNISLEVA